LLLLLFVSASSAQTTKELDERLLYILDQSTTPSPEAIQQLLDKGAEVNAQTDDGTALMMAVRRGHTEIVKLLLAAGAQVDAKHRLGDSALIMSARRSIPEMNPPHGQPLPPPASEIMSLLLASHADPNFIGHWGQTALMDANTAAKVKLLVTHGAQVNVKDEMGKTALVHAVDRGVVAVVEALLQAGADASIPDEKGTTALLYALQEPSPFNREGSTALRVEAAKLLLKGKVGDVNGQNENGETPLMRAVDLGEMEIVKSLLDHGANVDLSDVLGSTAAIRAYEKDQTAIQQLLKAQTPTRPVLNAFLRAAVGKKDQAKVRELLKAGADANYEYAIGFDHQNIKSTVLILAAQTGDASIVKLLLDFGANITAKGLLRGSEHGLDYGTALDATKDPTLLNLLRKSQ
jgi:ankyrin repeat protein